MENTVMTGTYTNEFTGEEISFNYYASLPTSKKLAFVNSVTDLVVDDDYYNTLIKDMMFDFYIVEIMTDVDTSEIRDSASVIDDIESFLEETNIVEIVKEGVVPGVIEELREAIDKNIEYKTGIHPDPIAESLSSLFNLLEEKVSDFDFDGIMGMAQSLSGISDNLTVDNLIEAYGKSDVFKETVANTLKQDEAMDLVKNNVIAGGKDAASSPLLSTLAPIV